MKQQANFLLLPPLPTLPGLRGSLTFPLALWFPSPRLPQLWHANQTGNSSAKEPQPYLLSWLWEHIPAFEKVSALECTFKLEVKGYLSNHSSPVSQCLKH
jgi:hypothetical protein